MHSVGFGSPSGVPDTLKEPIYVQPFQNFKSGFERGYVRSSLSERQRRDDAAGHRQQDRRPAFLRNHIRRLDVVAFADTDPSRGAVPVGRTDRGFVFAFITIFKKEWAPVTAPIYALCEGLALGGISAVLNRAYPGIALQAFGLTGAVTAVMLLLYTSGGIQATPKFTVGVIVATAGICLIYLVDLVTGLFVHHVSLLYSSGPWGIVFSVFIVIVAALNLILDFDFVQTGVRRRRCWSGARVPQ